MTQSTSRTRPDLVDFEATRRTAESLVSEGVHAGLQVAVMRLGEELANFAVGVEHGGDRVSPRNLHYLSCASKPALALAVAALVDRGTLSFDDRVTEYLELSLPDDWHDVTLGDLSAHSAGAHADRYWREFHVSPDDAFALIAGRPPRRQDDGRLAIAYSAWQSWFLMRLVIERVAGEPVDAFVRSTVFAAYGTEDLWMVMSSSEHAAHNARLKPLSWPGLPGDVFDSPNHAQSILLDCSCHGTALALARLYDGLLRDCNGAALLLSREMAHMALDSASAGYDWNWECDVSRSRLGFITIPGYFGLRAKTAAGTEALRYAIGFADRSSGIAVGWVATSHAPDHVPYAVVRDRLSRAISEDLHGAATISE